MFVKDEKIESIIDKIKKEASVVDTLNYEELMMVSTYLENYKKYLLKKVEESDE